MIDERKRIYCEIIELRWSHILICFKMHMIEDVDEVCHVTSTLKLIIFIFLKIIGLSCEI